MRSAPLVLAYLGSITAANLLIAQLGPAASIPSAFALIGLDLVVRDALHERWEGHRLAPRMLSLVLGGSLLSAALSAGASRIALASFLAFGCAGLADAGAYAWLRARRRSWLERSNGSNLAGAAVDSFVFVSLAFGWRPEIMLAQLAAKLLGGLLWSLVLAWLRRRALRRAWAAQWRGLP